MSNVNKLELDLYRVGATLALKNSKDLFASAELVIGNNIGHATSLLILSCEEAAKSIVLFAAANNMMIDPGGVKPYLYNHKVKHQLLLVLIFVSEWLINHDENGHEVYSYMQKKDVNKFIESISSAADMINDSASKEYINTRKWLVTANTFKNSGLYVNFDDGEWCTPNDIGNDYYQTSHEIVSNLINKGRLASIFDKRYRDIEPLVSIRENFKGFTDAIDSYAGQSEKKLK